MFFWSKYFSLPLSSGFRFLEFSKTAFYLLSHFSRRPIDGARCIQPENMLSEGACWMQGYDHCCKYAVNLKSDFYILFLIRFSLKVNLLSVNSLKFSIFPDLSSHAVFCRGGFCFQGRGFYFFRINGSSDLYHISHNRVFR